MYTFFPLYMPQIWRNNGIAFTWLEGEPIRSNPTLLSNVIKHGQGFLHYAYQGDIVNGPFFVWDSKELKDNQKKYRATDISEMEVLRAIYEIRTKEPLCDEFVGAHRDSTILNGIIVTEMPENEMERETWNTAKRKEQICWTDVENHKVIFHPMTSLDSMKSKAEFLQKFDAIWVANNATKQIPNLSPLLKHHAPMLIESCKYLVEFREEALQSFVDNLKTIAHANGLQETFDLSMNDSVFRFHKI